MENETRELKQTESRHDVQIAVMANDMKHISRSIDDIKNDIKMLGASFVKSSEFESWKGQEFDELRKQVQLQEDVLIKHTVSITRIMTYGTAIISVLGLLQIALSIFKSVK